MLGLRLWQIAGWTMLHYLWIGAALGVVALLARQRLRSASANVRYQFALGSLLLLSAAPAAIAVVVMQNFPPDVSSAPLPVPSVRQPESIHLEETPPMAAMNTPVPAVSANPLADATQPHGNEKLLAALNLAAMCLPWFWVCGAPLSFALTTAGLLGAERLRRQSHPLEDARITEMCRQLAASLKISYRVGVAVCDRIAAPILVGVIRPMILLPAAALAGWDPQQLEMVLLHELAHVRRYDNLVNLLQRIVESLLFFQPMIWIVSGWVRREREHCCDALVVARTRQPHAYAEMLVTLAERFSQGTSSLVHPQAFSSMAERPLVARIRRILKKEEQAMQVSRKPVGLAFICFIALTVMICGYYSLPSRVEDSLTASEQASSDASAELKSATSTKTPAGEKNPAEALAYTGQVTDKLTGKPIVGASVTVLRRVSSRTTRFPEWRKLGETKHQTDADGRYAFTIPPEQVAEGYLYIEITATHPDYVRYYGGYSFGMIRKNEKLGERPFFESLALEPAEKIFGTVATPDGKAVKGVMVKAFSSPGRHGLNHSSWSITTTSEEGFFQFNVSKGGEAVFWILPNDYAPSTHVLHTKRGDLGRFVLEKGLVLKGRVVDTDGKPLKNVWVNADIRGGPAKQQIDMPVFDYLARSALSDDKGEFSMAPLPAGDYNLIMADRPRGGSGGDVHPLPAVFVNREITLDQDGSVNPIEVRAVPHVLIAGQFFDSLGKPISGRVPDLSAHNNDSGSRTWFWDSAQIDKHGKFTVKSPKDFEATLDITDNEHHAIKTRASKDGPLNNGRTLNLGVLDRDMTEVAIIRYVAPILLVKAVTEDSNLLGNLKLLLKGVQPKIKYMPGRYNHGEYIVDGKPAGDVSFERQHDGRYRTSQLLPDEEFTLTVEAEGYEPKSEKLKLPEGETKELEVRLKKKS